MFWGSGRDCETYHVADLSRGAGKDVDHLGAVGGAAVLEVGASRRDLAGLDLGGVLDLDGGGGQRGDETGGSEELEELHVCGWFWVGEDLLNKKRLLSWDRDSDWTLEAG